MAPPPTQKGYLGTWVLRHLTPESFELGPNGTYSVDYLQYTTFPNANQLE